MSFKKVKEGSDSLKHLQDYTPDVWDTREEDSVIFHILRAVSRQMKLAIESAKDVMNSHFLNIPQEVPLESPDNIEEDTEHVSNLPIGGIALTGGIDQTTGEFKGGAGELTGLRAGLKIDEADDLYRSRLLASIEHLKQGGGSAPAIKTLMKLATRRLEDAGAHPEGYTPEIVETHEQNFQWGTDGFPPSGGYAYWGTDLDLPSDKKVIWGFGSEPVRDIFFYCKFVMNSVVEEINEYFFNFQASNLVGNITESIVLQFDEEDLNGNYKDLTEIAADNNEFSLQRTFDYIIGKDSLDNYESLNARLGNPDQEFQFTYPKTEIIRPNGDISTEWEVNGSGNHWDCIDDEVEQPTAGDTGNRIQKLGVGTNVIDIFDMTTLTISGHITSVRVWGYHSRADGSAFIYADVDIGDGWEGEQSWAIIAPLPIYEWYSAYWGSLEALQSDLDSIKIRLRGYTDDAVVCATMYAEISYSGVDEIYICDENQFDKIAFMFETVAVGAANQVVEYWNGTWNSISITDGTNGFQQNGVISFTKPGDWTKVNLNATGLAGSPPDTGSKYILRIRSLANGCEISTIMPCDDVSGNAESHILIGSDEKQTGIYSEIGVVASDDLFSFSLAAAKYPQIVTGLSGNWISKQDSEDNPYKLIGSSKQLENTNPFERNGKDFFIISSWENLQLTEIKSYNKYWLLIDFSYNILTDYKGYFLLKRIKNLIRGFDDYPDFEQIYRDGESECQHIEFPIETNTLQYVFEMIPDDDPGQIDMDAKVEDFPDGSGFQGLKLTLLEVAAKDPHSGVRLTPFPYDLDNGGMNKEVTQNTYVRNRFYYELVGGSNFAIAFGYEFNDPDDLSQMKYQLLYTIAGTHDIIEEYDQAPNNAFIDLSGNYVEGEGFRISRNLYEDFVNQFGEEPPTVRRPIPLLVLVKNGDEADIVFYTTDNQLVELEHLNDLDYWTQPSNKLFLHNLLQKFKAGGVKARLLFIEE